MISAVSEICAQCYLGILGRYSKGTREGGPWLENCSYGSNIFATRHLAKRDGTCPCKDT